jgi:hypothetical protein
MLSKERKMRLPIFERSSMHAKTRLHHVLPVWQHLWPVLAMLLLPLLLLAGIGAGTLGLIILVRAWTAGDTFLVRQLYLLLVVSVGLMLAVVTYTSAIVFALRKIHAWHKLNQSRKAHGATWGLGFTALAVSLPLLLALFLH